MTNYRIAIPIIGPDMRSVREDLETIAGLYKPANVQFIGEIRADKITDLKIGEIHRTARVPLIFTARHKSQGGSYEGDEKSRLKLLQKAIDVGFPYVDVERAFYSGRELRKIEGTKLIVSHHDFEGMPDLIDKYDWITKVDADIVKLAVTAKKAEDIADMFALLKQYAKEKPLIGLCMGETGRVSRIYGPILGSCLTFACLDGKSSAPGQLTYSQLLDEWEEMKVI